MKASNTVLSVLEYDLLQEAIEKFLHEFEISNLEHFKDSKYHSTFIVGNNPISVAGTFVLDYLVQIDSGLGSEKYIYPLNDDEETVVTIKNFDKSESFIYNLYEKMIPFVKIVNQQLDNGFDYIEALNVASKEMNVWLNSLIENSKELLNE
jgi:hypothetical protein